MQYWYSFVLLSVVHRVLCWTLPAVGCWWAVHAQQGLHGALQRRALTRSVGRKPQSRQSSAARSRWTLWTSARKAMEATHSLWAARPTQDNLLQRSTPCCSAAHPAATQHNMLQTCSLRAKDKAPAVRKAKPQPQSMHTRARPFRGRTRVCCRALSQSTRVPRVPRVPRVLSAAQYSKPTVVSIR